MGFFVRPDWSYYENDKESPLDVEVPKRPSQNHSWNGVAWVITPERQAAMDKEAADQTFVADAKADVWINWTQQDVSNFVENNGTTLAGVRVILKKIIWVVILLVRRSLR